MAEPTHNKFFAGKLFGDSMHDRGIAASLMVVLSCAQARAQEPAYLGVWAASPKLCRAGMTTEDAAFRIRRSAVEGFEWRCRITPIADGNRSWRVALACIREGIPSERTVSWRIRGGRLLEGEGGRTTAFVRCGTPRS